MTAKSRIYDSLQRIIQITSPTVENQRLCIGTSYSNHKKSSKYMPSGWSKQVKVTLKHKQVWLRSTPTLFRPINEEKVYLWCITMLSHKKDEFLRIICLAYDDIQ